MENKALGKGLSALISKNNFQSGNEDGKNVSTIDIKLIKNNSLQPRLVYDKDKLDELKASIKEKGVLQPILIRASGDHYEVVAGERRLRASRELGLTQVPVIIKNVTDREALVIALVENIQREELNGIEEAKAYKRLIEEFEFTQDTVAQSLGKDRSTISNLLRLLKLPTIIQDHVSANKISVGHARALLTLENSDEQIKISKEIIAKSLSVRQVEAAVQKHVALKQGKPTTKAKPRNRDIQILEEELSRSLGTKVMVEDKNNKGKVVIEYYSLDDFDRILEVLRR